MRRFAAIPAHPQKQYTRRWRLYHFCGFYYPIREVIPIAIYHWNIGIVSRGKGKSAVAAAAYRSGEKLTNEWDGMTHDYTRKGGVVHTEIMLPPHAPPSFSDRSTLWNSVELYEKAGNAQLAREIDAALPIELSREEQIRLVREYCSSQFVSRGMCVDFAIHDTDSGNPHCHIMLTMRPLDERGAWAAKSKKKMPISAGLRINPECSTQEGHEIYDPCGAGSRLGITRAELDRAIANGLDLSQIDGFHFHTLCEQNSDDLEKTLDAVEAKFGDLLYNLKWLNMGGGHHITRADYDIAKLEECITHMQEKYDLEIYLEPGEAVALNAGYLETTVLDIVQNGDVKILILDTSAACHMPDVLEMPYRPPLKNSGEAGEKKYTYRLSSCTCLAGDVIGDYSFDREIQIGDRLTFCDMAIYSMVKNNTFNGMPLPDIAVMDADGECRVIRRFGYEDFKCRLS